MDFENLYSELEQWKTREILNTKNNANLDQDDRKEIFLMILSKEIELLRTIEQLKMNSLKSNHKEAIHSFLKSLGQPKLWENYDNRFSEVVTPLTEIASKLFNLYVLLSQQNISIEERLDVLLKLKHVIKGNNTDLAEEIKQLINREADMINRKRPTTSLQGLRTRLTNLFLRYIENPKNNPELSRYQKQTKLIISKVEKTNA